MLSKLYAEHSIRHRNVLSKYKMLLSEWEMPTTGSDVWTPGPSGWHCWGHVMGPWEGMASTEKYIARSGLWEFITLPHFQIALCFLFSVGGVTSQAPAHDTSGHASPPRLSAVADSFASRTLSQITLSSVSWSCHFIRATDEYSIGTVTLWGRIISPNYSIGNMILKQSTTLSNTVGTCYPRAIQSCLDMRRLHDWKFLFVTNCLVLRIGEIL